jgi:flavorubredoxin
MAARHQGTLNRPNPLPREVAPGVFWLGECLEQRQQGKIYHGCNASFLIVGGTSSMLVETGHPKDFPIIESQLNALMVGKPPLQYLFVTHQETPHCGGLGRVLSRYPEAILCGDVSDYHLAFPEHEHRMRMMKEGDEIDLGGRGFRAVEPVVRDMRTTWWGFETRERVLFPGDGFAYSHYHEDGHCGLVAEEAASLDLQDTTAVFADLALWWTKWADMRNYCDRLDRLIETLGVKTVCPTHGLVITDVAKTMPKVKEGLLYGSSVAERGTNDASFGKSAVPVPEKSLG